jgi:steroid delta-isomerase-like uncharacterized protein
MSHITMTHNVTAVALIQAWNERNVEGLVNLYAESCVLEDIGLAKPIYGRDGARRLYVYTQAGFGSLDFTLHRTVEQDGQIVLEWSATGKQIRKIMGIPATNRQLTMTGTTWLVVRDGLITHSRRVWDMAGLLRQMGLLPDLPTV